MTRTLLLAALVLATPAVARCGSPGPSATTFQKFIGTEVVVTGKVTAIEKATVEATLPDTGTKDKFAYTVAVVKVDGALVGATGLTHIKVGFVPLKLHPNSKPQFSSGGSPRAVQPVPELKDGQEVLLFLVKHPTADFYTMRGGACRLT